jgi:hypothetical protein
LSVGSLFSLFLSEPSIEGKGIYHNKVKNKIYAESQKSSPCARIAVQKLPAPFNHSLVEAARTSEQRFHLAIPLVLQELGKWLSRDTGGRGGRRNDSGGLFDQTPCNVRKTVRLKFTISLRFLVRG